VNAVDVNQADVTNAVGVGIDDNHLVPANRSKFGVPDLIDLAIGQSQLKWLKRLTD
jgi:hypothetical protein